MEYRKLGKSGIKISKLAFGAWAIGGWLWGGADAKEAIKAIKTAVDNGMTTIDTAAVYGFGLSEKLVGEAIKGKRSEVQILTKFGLIWDEQKGKYYMATKNNSGQDVDIYSYASKEKVISDCDLSLKRLGTDYIDLFQIHWPDSITPVSETMEALEILVQQGKIRAGGVSNFSVDQMSGCMKTFNIASNQMPYSMVNRAIEKDVVPYCIENNIGILAYSPLQRGILTGKFRKGHKFSDGDNRPTTLYYKEPNLSKIIQLTDNLSEIANDRKITVSQLVLNWTTQQPGITCVLAGARDSVQVLDNIKAANFQLTEEEIERINKHISTLKLDLNI